MKWMKCGTANVPTWIEAESYAYLILRSPNNNPDTPYKVARWGHVGCEPTFLDTEEQYHTLKEAKDAVLFLMVEKELNR